MNKGLHSKASDDQAVKPFQRVISEHRLGNSHLQHSETNRHQIYRLHSPSLFLPTIKQLNRLRSTSNSMDFPFRQVVLS